IAVLATKVVQVAIMSGLAVWLRPSLEQDDPGRRRRWSDLSPAERQIWTLVPSYYGSFLVLLLLNRLLPHPIPLAPVLAILSGIGFASLGAGIWVWFYVWWAAFIVLALLILLARTYGMTLLRLR